MKIRDVIDPNKRLPESSIVWYFVALGLMIVAIWLCFSAKWQTDGFVAAVYDDSGSLSKASMLTNSNKLSIAPHVTSLVWAMLIYGALLVRRCVRNFINLPTFLLVVCNIIFMASLIESFLPAQSICILKCLRWEVFCVNPQTLLISAVLLSWVGMRALSGVSILILGIAFLSRAQEINVDLGLHGAFYVLSGFLSIMVQIKLPYMVPEGGWRATLLQDFGVIQAQAVANVNAMSQQLGAIASGATSVTKGVVRKSIPKVVCDET